MASEVLAGKTFSTSQGVNLVGTMVNQEAKDYTPSAKEQPIVAGYYNGSGVVKGDVNLVSSNIKAGVKIFGVSGDVNVVDTSSGDATTSEILSGKKAWVAGKEVVGTGQLSSGLAAVSKTGEDSSVGVGLPNPRFMDNSDGTVMDNLTNLIWLKNANCFGVQDWSTALTSANSLLSGNCGLSDGSVVGDWRLPSINELRSLIHWGFYEPALSNAAGTSKWSENDPFTSVQSGYYWSVTTGASDASGAWSVGLSDGGVYNVDKTSTSYVWPVRGGQ
ncbi:MAG: DUF1566 domain-containing protein [Thioploca sp.]|nr:DUF1566 domain-containing protein [Thioploca sp.]